MINLAVVISVAVAVFGVTAWFTRRFCNPDSVVYMLDYPNDRSLHDRPVPRGGGVAILVGIVVGGVLAAAFHEVRGLGWLGLGMLAVAGVSFVDDRRSVSAVYRLAVHVVSAYVVVMHGDFALGEFIIPGVAWRLSPAAGVVFSVLFAVWMINLYNFMDGMDGFSGGMAVAGFGAFAALGAAAGHSAFFMFSAIIAAASLAFLVFNFPPARIFMGDVGSSTLGMLAAAFSLWGARDGVFPFWIAILVFSPFIADATVTLVRRLLRGEKIWQAHRSHFYQKLVQAGWGHRRTVLVEYAVMFACALSAVWGVRASGDVQLGLFIGWLLFYFLFFSWISRKKIP